jgi:predicted RND superfamily exporter protein
MIFSSVLMIAGYCMLGTSQFRLTVLFGLLCAQTILVALLSDLIVTPWVVRTFRPRFGRAATPVDGAGYGLAESAAERAC